MQIRTMKKNNPFLPLNACLSPAVATEYKHIRTYYIPHIYAIVRDVVALSVFYTLLRT